jgi:hypothetical protein
MSGLRIEAFQMASEHLGCRNRQRRVEENLGRWQQSPRGYALVENVKQLLCPLQRQCGNDDVAAAPEGVGNGLIEFLDRRSRGLVSSVAVGRLDDNHVGSWRPCRRAQPPPPAIAKIA